MQINRQKESQGSFYHRISLPKQINSQLKSTSTRCMSVNKHEAKPLSIGCPLINKTMVQPKPLTVNRD